MGPSLALVGTTTATVFEAYVGQVLVPSLRRGQIVVLDNLGAHKSERDRELIEERGCQLLLYLPPYSPDFNPSRKRSRRSRRSRALCEKHKPEPAKP